MGSYFFAALSPTTLSQLHTSENTPVPSAGICSVYATATFLQLRYSFLFNYNLRHPKMQQKQESPGRVAPGILKPFMSYQKISFTFFSYESRNEKPPIRPLKYIFRLFSPKYPRTLIFTGKTRIFN